MAAKRCMNAACGVAAPLPGGEWRKGWTLRSGGFAPLCDKCGMAYEQLVFCDIFHQKETGWRECNYCAKRLHCGCVASKYSFDLLDGGGVQCIECMKNSEPSFIPSQVLPKLLSPQTHQRLLLSSWSLSDQAVAGRSLESPVIIADGENSDAAIGKGVDVFLGKDFKVVITNRREIENQSEKNKWEPENVVLGETGRTSRLNGNPYPVVPSQSSGQDDKDVSTENVTCESLAEACLSMNLGIANSGCKLEGSSNVESQIVLPPSAMISEGREFSSPISTFQMQKAHLFQPKPLWAGQSGSCDTIRDGIPQLRVARPPADGRGRNQLLPRYWPRITDKELQQISGNSNSTIVPLFEKVLSASDTGRIGRLVLPKACAEAYFPPISQPEGRPLTIQDATGKEWHFQFRFWPNNNSRMYVLEGVTPCMQFLQLQAGDTVTFSRIEPGGKLVMGFRKATNTVTLQDSQISAIANGSFVNETFFSNTSENLSKVSGYSAFLQSIKGAVDHHSSSLSEHANSADGDVSWLKTDKLGGGGQNEGSFQGLQKRSRGIGSKSRRLVMDNEDALELRLTWEEAQDLLRPAPTSRPSIVVIENYEFEEYEEPPVFAKRTIFTVRVSGEQDQWIQCDDCFKWRRLPVHVLIASKWTCTENSWDTKNSSCSMPDELNPKELQNLLGQFKDLKRRRMSCSFKENFSELDSSGLDSLASAAAPGDIGSQAVASVATTTKHPRHRPGCTCIVCIQPPSGKGPKHDPSCTCNVCMTVRRRFKTLEMRKKQRQSEREEAEANKKITGEGNSNLLRDARPLDPLGEKDLGTGYDTAIFKKLDTSKGRIDLNFHPGSGQDPRVGQPVVLSMTNLLEVANRPLESYLKQNGLTSLAGEQGSSSTVTVPQAPADSEEKTSNEAHQVCLASMDCQHDNGTHIEFDNQDKVLNGAA